MNKRNKPNRFVRAVKKFFLSAFVVISFLAYALENRNSAANNPTASAQIPQTGSSAADPATSTTTSPFTARPTTAFTAPTATPVPTTRSGLKDGTYTGTTINVDWGLVQVQVTIQSGKISNVQFLQYPQDRRTSQRINSFAVPQLQQEAVKAQSANVNIVTGATLTSEGFQMSLQDALNQAKG